MNREWMVSQHPNYLAVGLGLSLLAGFLVGGAVASVTSAFWVAAGAGAATAVWAGVIYFWDGS